MAYLPIHLVDFYGKCRYGKYTIHGMGYGYTDPTASGVRSLKPWRSWQFARWPRHVGLLKGR